MTRDILTAPPRTPPRRIASRGLVLGLSIALLASTAACAPAPAAPPPAATAVAGAIATPANDPTAAPVATTPPAPPTPTMPPSTATVPPATPTLVPTPSASEIINRALASQPAEFSFDSRLVTETTSTGAKAETQARGFVKDKRYRVESSQGNQKVTMLLDDGKNELSVLTEVSSKKIALRFSDESLAKSLKMEAETPRTQLERLGKTARQVGTETLDGRPAIIFEAAQPDGKTSSRFWFWTERGVLLREQRAIPTGKSVIEYSNYQFAAQPDDLFKVPADYQVQDGAAFLAANQPKPAPKPTPKP
jgi:hypothetical protein